MLAELAELRVHTVFKLTGKLKVKPQQTTISLLLYSNTLHIICPPPNGMCAYHFACLMLQLPLEAGTTKHVTMCQQKGRQEVNSI